MLRDDILTAKRRISSFSGHEAERSAKNEEVLDNQKNIKMISQRHEANEKQGEMIFSWARSGRKDLVFLRKKNRGFFSEEEKKSKDDAISCSEQCLG
jgi:hypothetical protein